MKWDLSAYYQSLNDPHIDQDLNQLETLIGQYIQHTNQLNSSRAETARSIEQVLKLSIDIHLLFDRLFGFGHLTVSTDVNNQTAKVLIDKVEKQETKLTKPLVSFQKWISGLTNLSEIISQNTFLKEHEFYLTELAHNARYLLNEEVEQTITIMKQTGSSSWSKLFGTLTSNQMVTIDLDGKSQDFPLSVARNFAYDKNQTMRQKAYIAELKSYKSVEEPLASAINSIKGEVIEISKLRGFTSPLMQTLHESRLNKQALDSMLEAIHESLPQLRKYLLKKARMLGHHGALPFYDLFAPVGELNLHFTYEEAQTFILDHFKTFSDELYQFAKKAFEEHWIDALPREGKRGGGFCSSSKSIKQSRILTNFTGVFNDLKVLAHELGHAYHSHMLKEETYLNSMYSMPVAETASIFCESIIKGAFLKKASSEEKLVILSSSIDDSIQTIVDIYSRYLFETELFKRRQNATVSVNELKQMMLSAQMEAYGEGLDKEALHPYMWACKPHYYYAGANFYNFPYAFGLLFSSGLYSIYLREKQLFVPRYNQLLKITGKNMITDITQSVGINIMDKNFWKNSLKIIESEVDSFLSL